MTSDDGRNQLSLTGRHITLPFQLLRKKIDAVPWSYRYREKKKETIILWGAGNFSTIIDFSLTEKGESGSIHAYLAFTSPSTAIDIKSESSNLFFIVCMFGGSLQRTNTQFLCFLRAPPVGTETRIVISEMNHQEPRQNEVQKVN